MNIRLSRMRTGVLAVGAALTLGLAGCSSGTPSSTSGGGSGAPTDGTLTVGLLGDIGQPPDPDIYYANNGTAIMISTRTTPIRSRSHRGWPSRGTSTPPTTCTRSICARA